jgi:hypothetical protein
MENIYLYSKHKLYSSQLLLGTLLINFSFLLWLWMSEIYSVSRINIIVRLKVQNHKIKSNQFSLSISIKKILLIIFLFNYAYFVIDVFYFLYLFLYIHIVFYSKTSSELQEIILTQSLKVSLRAKWQGGVRDFPNSQASHFDLIF